MRKTVAEGRICHEEGIRHEEAIRPSVKSVHPIMGRFAHSVGRTAPSTGVNWCTKPALFFPFFEIKAVKDVYSQWKQIRNLCRDPMRS